MQQALSVSAVVSFLREVLEANEFFSDLWLAGEVSSYTRSQLGHRYFSLRDQGAVLRTVLFRDTMPGLNLKEGDRVLAHGRITVYPQRGDLQFVSDFVRPEGVGILAARSEELRLRLEREGLFALERKRALPRFPLAIGVVTSPAGAALQDIRQVLERRWPVARLVLAPAMVQGPEAPADIADAIRRLGREPGLDLLIVARGGGSAEDLAAFDSEVVARAIFSSTVPVVSGVGHETDETIADYVADMRAPTPSAAAERATPDIREVQHRLALFDRGLASAAGYSLAGRADRVVSATGRMSRAVPRPDLLQREARTIFAGMTTHLARQVAEARGRTATVEGRLTTLDPRATLARGFALVQKADTRKVVTSIRKVRPGDRLSIAVADGAFWGEVS